MRLEIIALPIAVFLLETMGHSSARTDDSHCEENAIKLYSALGYELYRDSCQERRSLLDLGCQPLNQEETSYDVSSFPSELRTVFMVIDVTNGYKRSFVNDEKKRRTENNLTSFPQLDLGYNHGFDIPAALFSNINDVIDNLGPRDLLVFTQDYLNPRAYQESRGHCYVDYQTLLAGHPGSFIQDDIQYARQGTHLSCAAGCSCRIGDKRIHILTHRKIEYDPFKGRGVTDPRPPVSLESCNDNDRETFENSNAPNHHRPGRDFEKMSLSKKLVKLGFPPGDPLTRLVTSGLSTNSCVRMASVSAKRIGYNVSYLEGGVAANSQANHELGIKLMSDVGIMPITASLLWTITQTQSHDENMVYLYRISQYYMFLPSVAVACFLLARTGASKLRRRSILINYAPSSRKHKL
jgi:nicotinamidase-related amidase